MITTPTDQPTPSSFAKATEDRRLRQATKKPLQLSGLHSRGRVRAVAVRRLPVRGTQTGVSGRFDSAATTADNRRHWANADGLSADSAASADVRRTLRNRAPFRLHAHRAGKLPTLLRLVGLPYIVQYRFG